MSDTMEKPGRSLGRYQLRWLREHVPAFAEAEAAVKAADENAARAKALLGADKKRRKA